MFFDTHAHYDDTQFDLDRESLLESLPKNGISLVVNAASDIASSQAAADLADRYSFIYAAAGIHPHEAAEMAANDLETLRQLLALPKVVALGEIGLDYHYDFSPRDVQKDVFRRQMEIARELHVPVIIHEREACADGLAIVTDFPDVQGVYHCYSGSWETAKTILRQGWYLSFTGAVTFKNARRAAEVVANMPLDRLMIETDCPYLAPVPNRGRRNSSLNLRYIAAKIAEIRGISVEEVAQITMENGRRFFGIES
jgi:TatD DNase family protein